MWLISTAAITRFLTDEEANLAVIEKRALECLRNCKRGGEELALLITRPEKYLEDLIQHQEEFRLQALRLNGSPNAFLMEQRKILYQGLFFISLLAWGQEALTDNVRA